MNKRKFLTDSRKRKMTEFLRGYLMEVLQEEEYLNTLDKCREEARRVECYGRRILTPGLVSDWLRGLPIGCAYMTYGICVMLLKAVGFKEEDVNKFDTVWVESMVDIDNFYWETLGMIIYHGEVENEEA